MSLFVICDTHLSTGVDKPMNVFGGRWQGYESKLKENWKNTVTDADTVIVGGDISWAMTLCEARDDLAFINSLPGKKIFVRGNHDYWWESLVKMKNFFEENEFGTLSVLQNDSFLCGDIAVCGTRGWFAAPSSAPKGTDHEKLSMREAQRLEMSIKHAAVNFPEAEPTVFLHLPPVYGGEICRPITETLTKYGIRRCYYGHIHGVYDIPQITEHDGVEYILTSSDYMDFVPLKVN